MELETTKKKGSPPDFKSDGCSVWVNKDKNGKQYLSIKLVGHEPIAVFKYEPVQKTELVQK